MLILVIMVLYVTMVYGPIAAFLVELFPTRIRYTSMSLPYHIGNGWFGGMLPLTATAMVAATGDIYYGLWYPIVVAVMTLVIGSHLPARDQGSRHPHLRARLGEGKQRRQRRLGAGSGWRLALTRASFSFPVQKLWVRPCRRAPGPRRSRGGSTPGADCQR